MSRSDDGDLAVAAGMPASVRVAAQRAYQNAGHDGAAPCEALCAAWSRAAAYVGEAELEPGCFFDGVVARLDSDLEPAAAVEAFPAEDFGLVLACVANVRSALTRLESSYLRPLTRSLGRMGLSAAECDDVQQRVLSELLLPRASDGKTPLLGYGARSSLRAWLRVVVARAALAGRRVPAAAEAFDRHIADSPDDTELTWLKQTYRGLFAEALGGALGDLSRRRRSLLRHQVVDGMTLDTLARIFHWSRSRVARELTEARGLLRQRTLARLGDELGVDAGAVGSVLRLIQSNFDASLRAALGAPSAEKNTINKIG